MVHFHFDLLIHYGDYGELANTPCMCIISTLSNCNLCRDPLISCCFVLNRGRISKSLTKCLHGFMVQFT